MSDSYGTSVPSGSGAGAADDSGTAETAKREAAQVKDTATEKAKDVASTVKDEASSVAGEAKSQAKELYAQTRGELQEQAGTQQQRIAVGLRAVGDELSSMADGSEQGGVASDLVQQLSGRLSSASSWLSDRDPSSVLDEVKRYARRKPGTFILGAVIAGVVVGRLTRALAANAADDKKSDTASVTSGGVDRKAVTALPVADAASATSFAPATATGTTGEEWDAPVPAADSPAASEFEDTPIYSQNSAPAWTGEPVSEDGDVRRDTF